MTRSTFSTVAVLAVVLVALPLGMGAAAAAENNTTAVGVEAGAEEVAEQVANATAESESSSRNETAESSSNETAGTTQINSTLTSTVNQTIDSDTRIVGWEFDQSTSTFAIEIDAEHATKITMVEAVQFREGSGSGALRVTPVVKGRSVIEIQVTPRAGEAGVTFTTARSIREERFAWISTGQASTGSPLDRTTSTAGWLGGAGVAVAMFGCAAYQRKNKDWPAVEEAE